MGYDKRIDDPSVTLIELLTTDELKLLGVPGQRLGDPFREINEFKRHALDLWGLNWEAHVPDPRKAGINMVYLYFWGEVLWGYQLKVTYCPFSQVQVLGARGTGKTKMFALIGATWVGMHPGNDWLAVAPTKDQVDKQYQTVIEDGRHDMQNRRDFMSLFITHHRRAPFSYLQFRRWDEYDPGSEAWFRSSGKPNEPGELLRSHECGLLTFDEAFRTYQSNWALRVVAGCLRGLNRWRANQRPDLKRQWQDMAMDLSVEDDRKKRKVIEDRMERFANRHGLAKETWSWWGGNAGYSGWPYRLQEAAKEGKRKVFAPTWYTRDNPAFTPSQREDLEAQFANDPDGLAMETEAKRPPPPGDIFGQKQIENLFDGDLDAELMESYSKEVPGYRLHQAEDIGIVEYALPWEPGHVYVGGGDGGTQIIPQRGKWVVMVLDVTHLPPWKVVYFRMGNLDKRDQGSHLPWLSCLYNLTNPMSEPFYPMLPRSLFADATGLQRGIFELAATYSEEEPVQLRGFNMTNKIPLIGKLQTILSMNYFKMCTVEQVEKEMGNYSMPDNPPMEQDCISAMLALAASCWYFKEQDLKRLIGPERIRQLQDRFKWQARQQLAERRAGRRQKLTRYSSVRREQRQPR